MTAAGLQVANGEQQFFDNNGDPLAGGFVYHYVPGTTTIATTWADQDLMVANPNPILLDAGGRAIIWGQPGVEYRQVVQDKAGNTFWDRVVALPTNAVALVAGNGISIVQSPGTDTISTNLVAGNGISINAVNGAENIAVSLVSGIGIGISGNTISAQVSGNNGITVTQGSTIGIGIAPTGVTPGSYSNPTLQVNAGGQITSVVGSSGGVLTGFAKPIAATYAVAGGDNGSVLFLSGGFFNVNFGAVGAYPAGFLVTLVNGDGGAGKKVSFNGATLMLWPQQAIVVFGIAGEGWYQVGYGPWQPTGPVTLFVNPSNGTDTNDGLSPNSALQHIQEAVNRVTHGSGSPSLTIPPLINSANQPVTVQVASPSSISETVGIFGGQLFADVFTISGDLNTPSNCLWQVGQVQTCVMLRDGGRVQLQGFELSCGAGGSCVSASQGGVADLSAVQFGSSVGANMIAIDTGGSVNFVGSCSLLGNASSWIFMSGGACSLGGQQFQTPNAINFSSGVIIVSGMAQCGSNGTPATFTNPGNVSGTSYIVGPVGFLRRDGTVIPGSTGSVTGSGQVS